MKLTSITTLAAALLLSAGLLTNGVRANGLPITGQIDFGGIVSDNSVIISSATEITVLFASTDYTSGTYSGNLQEPTGISIGTPATFVTNPISVSPLQSTPFPLWSVTSNGVVYSFQATSIDSAITLSPDSLTIGGQGLASIAGGVYATTPGSWSIAITDANGQAQAVFGFGSDTSVAPTPDSGTTAMLIALGLAGIGIGLVAQRRGLAKA